jgi:hypothetical protein
MFENYRDFMKYWTDRLKGNRSHLIFASINIYNILKYLKVYWDANKKEREEFVNLKGIERILVKDLLGLIENECPHFKIIKRLNPSCAESLSKDIIILSADREKRLRIRINEGSIKNIDKILKLCHDESFKRLAFNRIFDLNESENDSKYLTDCILRILVEEHCIDFLSTLPVEAFIRCVMDTYSLHITQALEKDFENHMEIFDSLHQFVREELLPAIEGIKSYNVDNPKAQIPSREYPNELRSKMENVVNYLREQFKHGNYIRKTEENSKKIIQDINFEKLAKRVEKCFYHYSFVYLIISLDTSLGDKLSPYLTKILDVNQFSNFTYFYNNRVTPSYYEYRLPLFSRNILSEIFIEMLIIVSKFYSFNIPNFSSKLKTIIDNYYTSNSNNEFNEFMNDNLFVTDLMSFFVAEYGNNLSRLIEILKNISLDKLNQEQRKRTAIQMFLKKLPKRIKENIELFGYKPFLAENIDMYFHSLLLYGKKKYRVFFTLKGVRTRYSDRNSDGHGDDTIVDLKDVLVYGDKWNFQESLSFQHSYSQKYEVLDKFKLKVFCDVKSNNPEDAFVEAKQRCFDAVSRITYTYFNIKKQQVPRFDPEVEITELPPKKGVRRAKMPQPIDMDKEHFPFLKDLSYKTADSISLRRSLAWFAEGHYAITEYSEFLNYWLSFETVLGILGKLTAKPGYTIVVFVHALVTQPQYLRMFLQQLLISTEGLGLGDGERGEQNQNQEQEGVQQHLMIISVLKRLSEDKENIQSAYQLIPHFIEAQKDELKHVFSRLFVINYAYARRNSLVHEGETFSFELGALSRILEVYAWAMLGLFKEYNSII